MPAVIGTWKFSEVGVCAASRMLEVGRTAADAVEEGIRVVELDESCHSVGYGGIPNADGVLQLDAGFMNGDGGCGAVMALEGYRTAIGVARRVMERSVHTVFAGRGAKKFAESIGLQSEPSASLITPHARQRYEEYLSGAVIEGEISVGCATSGAAFKEAGRVGDSPLIGSGLFADRNVGAASATGDGDQMIRFCLSFFVVELMRMGSTPQAACNAAIDRLHQSDPQCQAAVIAMDMQGHTASACTRSGFTAVTWDPESDLQHTTPTVVNAKAWLHKCV